MVLGQQWDSGKQRVPLQGMVCLPAVLSARSRKELATQRRCASKPSVSLGHVSKGIFTD